MPNSLSDERYTYLCVNLKGIQNQEFEKIAMETYAVYCACFTGRTYDSWKERLNANTNRSEIILIKKNSDIVGYNLIQFREIEYQDEKIILCLLNAAALPGHRGATLSKIMGRMKCFSDEHPKDKVLLIDNVLNPLILQKMGQYFIEVFPSPNLTTPPELTELRQWVAENYLGCSLDKSNPGAAKSASSLKQGNFRKKTVADNQYFKLFSDITGDNPQYGALTLVPLDAKNYKPALRPYSDVPKYQSNLEYPSRNRPYCML